MCDLSSTSTPVGLDICEKCEIDFANLLLGSSFDSRVQIYFSVLSDLVSSFYGICSNNVAEVLQIDHSEVKSAMMELDNENFGVFELIEDYDHGPIQITKLGCLFLNTFILQRIENGLLYKHLLEVYPKELIDIGISEKWLDLSLRKDLKAYVVAGPKKKLYKSLYTALQSICSAQLVSGYEKHKLLTLGFISPSPIIPILKIKKGRMFPIHDPTAVFRIWIKMIDILTASKIKLLQKK